LLHSTGRPAAIASILEGGHELAHHGWDHTPPGPALPPDVVANTRAKYVDAYERISGRKLAG